MDETIPLYIDKATKTVVSPDAPTTLLGYGIIDGGLPGSTEQDYFLVSNSSEGWEQKSPLGAMLSLGITDSNGSAILGDGASVSGGVVPGGAALGKDASAIEGGGSVGRNSFSLFGGGAVGYNASAQGGGAVGGDASSTSGGAAGNNASTTFGAAVGNNASSTTGGAIGQSAVASADGAVQLGGGTNSTADTIQFRDSGPVTAAQFGRLGARSSGFVDYNDTTGSITLVADTWTDVPNNAAGAFTNTTYKPTSVTSLIDTSTGYLDFDDLTLGSEILIRNDFTVVPQTNNALLEARYLLGSGAGEYQLLFWSERLDSGSGIDYQRVTNFPIYMGDLNTKDNPGKLQVRLSSGGTITNSGSYISIRIY